MVEILSKSLDTSTTNGNNVLDPVFLSKIISEQVRTIPSLRNTITRVSWPGRTYTWDLVTDFGIAQSAPDGGTIALSDATFAQANANMSFYYYAAYITNPAIAAAQELIDVVAMRVGHAVRQVMRFEGAAIFNGDPVNASNPGLKAALSTGPNANVIGSGAIAGRSMFQTMDIQLRAQGYTPGCFVVSPNLYSLISDAAYNQVRFIGTEGSASVGFSLANNNLNYNGVPVMMDYYAQSFVPVTSETLAGSGTSYTFSHGAATQRIAGTNYAGSAWTAPVISVSGSVVSNYSINANGVVTFTSAPAAAPVASSTYVQDNAYCLSLNPMDLVIAELMPLSVDNDLGKPVQTDSVPLRVKEYCTLAVRDPKAHILAANCIAPAASAFLNL